MTKSNDNAWLWMFKGIGGGSRSKMGFLVILKIPDTNFQELFTESKNLALLSRGDVAKLGRTPKSYTFWAP